MTNKFLIVTAIAGLAFLPSCSKAETPQTETQTSSQTAVQQTKITHVNAVQASDMMTARPGLTVLDVRTPREFAAGHIDGAINIDFKNASFSSELSKLDPSQDYLIHCRSGGRSTSSLKTFKRLGFSHIIHMDGGMNGWTKANLPEVK